MLARILIGAALAGVVSAGAARGALLSWSGAGAATVIGTIAVTAGWSWGVMLIVFFALTSALSVVGRERKRQAARSVLARGATRDTVQVLANGGVFTAAALGWAVSGSPVWLAMGAGALAAAAADSWATEIGIPLGGTPRSITSGRPLIPGESGGVTLAGTLGGVAGAAVMAATVLIMNWPLSVAVAAALAGVLGMLIDSVLGATWQARRLCVACDAATEQRVHRCGNATVIVGGVAWVDNDIVNVISTLSGAAIAAAAFLLGA